MADKKQPAKVSPVMQERRRKAARDAQITGFMAGNPLVRELMLEKLRTELAELRQTLEEAVNEPLDRIRLLQGRITATKDLLSVVSGTT